MNSKAFLTLVLILLSVASYGQVEKIDPTGSYILEAKKIKNGEKGSHGEIHVKLIENDLAAISFYYNVGHPSYNSGSFVDTLAYKDNKIIYTYKEPGEVNPDCKLTFTFEQKRVIIKHEASDYNFSCGFGHGVIANLTIKKKTNRIPIIKDYWDK
ncbi:hypothetical protein [Rufibacter ruber]|uniref:hypothetical protein n=1 Tax=Rufibacter ruber TaxID=1783499 RepID=UPI000831E3C8|nr:hypothetical protein [Rufibacter ruber]